jgi:hypothetical protein
MILVVEVQRRRKAQAKAGAILLALLLLWMGRTVILRAAGWALVTEDALQSADAVVVAIGAGDAAVLEAADLIRSGIAPRVAVFAEPQDKIEHEFLKRGLRYETVADHATHQLSLLGVINVERIPLTVLGSEDMGNVLPGWCDQRGFRRVVIVSTSDHTRRLRRILRRALAGRGVTAVVRRARYSEFDPDRWWQSRAGARIEVVELEKLLFDIVRHPIS